MAAFALAQTVEADEYNFRVLGGLSDPFNPSTVIIHIAGYFAYEVHMAPQAQDELGPVVPRQLPRFHNWGLSAKVLPHLLTRTAIKQTRI